MPTIKETFTGSETSVLKLTFEEPNQCPLCKKAIKPYFLYGWINETAATAYAVFECRSCFSAFIKIMPSINISTRTAGSIVYNESSSSTALIAPNNPTTTEFSKYIIEASPQFIKIYNQANTAECYGLDEIAGIGYRKSLEFLIKDYLISNISDEDEKDNIRRKPLASCINDNIDSKNLQIVASRAAWIGNDEAHYIRRHEDKDITDLKRLIDLTVRWIESEFMTLEAEGIVHKPPK